MNRGRRHAHPYHHICLARHPRACRRARQRLAEIPRPARHQRLHRKRHHRSLAQGRPEDRLAQRSRPRLRHARHQQGQALSLRSQTANWREQDASTSASPAWTPRPARKSGPSNIPPIYKDQYGYNNGPRCSPLVDGDLVYTTASKACSIASRPTPANRLERRRRQGIQRHAELLRRRQHARHRRRPAHRPGRRQSRRQPPRDLFDQTLKGNGTGVVAFDKRTGKVGYKISDELASYASPVLATINGRRWCFVFARGGLLAFDPANGKIDFHFPWRSRRRRKRQRQQSGRHRRPGASSPKPTAPAAPC